ncbi:Uncharacterised protein [uncultured archaeon]|nr:Uncharacterised protein [uncultured archaeon]
MGRIVTKYCWIGVPSVIFGAVLFAINPFSFLSGLFFAIGGTIITLNLLGRLKKW